MSRDRVNLKILEDLPEEGDGVKRWRIRFKYSPPREVHVSPITGAETLLQTEMKVKQVHFVGTVRDAQSERDHLKYYLKRGLDPDDYPRDHESPQDALMRPPSKGETTFKTLVGKLEDDSPRSGYYLMRTTEGLASTTILGERQILRDHVIPAIGSWIVERAEFRDFQDLRMSWHKDYLQTKKYSPATLNHWVRVLKHFVGWCCRRQGVLHQARDLKSFPKPPKKGRAMGPQEAEQFLEILKANYPQWYAVTYLSLYGGGLRWSSVSALRWEDVDEPNGVIWVKRSQTRGKLRDGTKTGHVFSIPYEPFKEVLKGHKEALLEASHPGLETGWIFPADGDPEELKYGGLLVYNSALNKIFKKICIEDLGVEKITHHDLRRTFVSIALSKGIVPHVIQSLTGHSDQMIGHYNHAAMASKKNLIQSVLGA